MKAKLKDKFIKHCKEFLNSNGYPDFIVNEIKISYFELLYNKTETTNKKIENTLKILSDKIVVDGFLHSRRGIKDYIETKYCFEFFSNILKSDEILKILNNKKENIINGFIETELETNIKICAEKKKNIILNKHLINRFKKYVYVAFVEPSFNSEKLEYRYISKSFIEKYYYIKKQENDDDDDDEVEALEKTIINSILNILKENNVQNIKNKYSQTFSEFIEHFIIGNNSLMAKYNPDKGPFFKWIIYTYYETFKISVLNKKTFYEENNSVKHKIKKMFREIRRSRLLDILKYVSNSYSKVEPELCNQRLLLKVYKKNKTKGFCKKTRKWLYYTRIKKKNCGNPNYITGINDIIIDYFFNYEIRYKIEQTAVEVVYKNNSNLNNEENTEYKIIDKQFDDIDFSFVKVGLLLKIEMFLEKIQFRKGIGRNIKDFIIEKGSENYFEFKETEEHDILVYYDKNKIIEDFLEHYNDTYNKETFIKNNNARTFFDKIHNKQNQTKLAKLLKEELK